MNPAPLDWREPLWLLLALLPLLPPLWRRLRGGGGEYAAPGLLPWVVVPRRRGRWWWLLSRDAAYLFGWLLLALAAAGPRLPLEGAGQVATGGPDLLMVVDLSRSMDAADVVPNRRRRAALESFEALDHARGSRVGIVVHAGRPHLYVPPTADRRALGFFLQSLDRLVLPTRGSATAPALALAQRTLAGAPGVVVLLTDGDLAAAEGGAVEAAVRALTAAGGRLHVLGIGSPEGEAIPLAGGGWLQHEGQAVVSRLDEARLGALARLGGGRYRRVADDDGDWAALLGDLAPAVAGDGVVWREFHPWLLLPGLLLLFVALMPYGLGRAAAPWLLLLLLPALPPPAMAAGPEAEAYRAFSAGEYAAAAALYAEIPGHAGRMGEGASRYRAGDYPVAAAAFTAAVMAAADDAGRADALFNLGGALYRLGDYAGAARVFGDVLLYRPGDAAAHHNQGLSEALRRAVQGRGEGDGPAGRAGRGVRSARVAPGTPVGEGASLSFDDDPAADEAPLPPLPADADVLIARGLAHAALVEGEQTAAPTAAWQQEVAQARLRMLTVEDDPVRLWQRLFEAAEGFPAPLPEPRNLPGVAPW